MRALVITLLLLRCSLPSTIIAYYYIAETNIAFINRKIHRPWLTFVLKLCLMASTVYGTVRTADLAWGAGGYWGRADSMA